nr:reverse transcriptase domain-containing protein [Tanacetum cinerariifolium]
MQRFLRLAGFLRTAAGTEEENSGNRRDQRNRGHQSNRSANSGSQQSRGPSEGYSYPDCTTCGRRHQGECLAAGASSRVFAITEGQVANTSGTITGTLFIYGHAVFVLFDTGATHSVISSTFASRITTKDCRKNTTTSTSGQADKKPGASGHVFAITEGQVANTSGTITGTLFIYGHALFVLFDTGATHSVISSTFASRITTIPTLLDHVLCISTPMQDSVRIMHVYRNLQLQFNDKIRAINAFPLDMCEFDLILGMDWLTEHHATIDCHSYRVIFGDIHAPEYTYHGSLPGKYMQIISALHARTLLYHGCEGFLATIHD